MFCRGIIIDVNLIIISEMLNEFCFTIVNSLIVKYYIILQKIPVQYNKFNGPWVGRSDEKQLY